jgi:chromosome partitioning protein
MNPVIKNPSPYVTLGEIAAVAKRVAAVVEQARLGMLPPMARKTAPTVPSAQLCAICEIDKGKLDYQVKKGNLPPGRVADGRRRFSLAEARAWTKELRKPKLRPSSVCEAVTISIGNFKGGVSKTTTAMTLAQGLSLRGHRVLAIDCDPQGSLTTLFGVLPDTEVEPEQTILPLCMGEADSIKSAIRPTYWDGIDLVAGAPLLFSAEFALPARQSRDRKFEFWNVLHYGIDPVRPEYDVIIIDTPPSLSYTTINAFLASDGIVMPLPPNALDFASSAQFWDLFSDLADQLVTARGAMKRYDFINVLLARVDSNDAASAVVREWIAAGYGKMVLPVEVPKTSLTVTASAEFGTVYDVERGAADARTYRRAADAYERVVNMIEEQIQAAWQRQLLGVPAEASDSPEDIATAGA